ncbi:hypothetical protein I4F81_010348 [Pyropia yezoensis]|uniref:Uncharacterized protein n=1 Tax=Pyropia yezoensis TaxID=2788 RepID=A0ACC3CCN1_PYRYE|nr:hypothetical protein I4F81_010348 [Neopyropia yezoensis]
MSRMKHDRQSVTSAKGAVREIARKESADVDGLNRVHRIARAATGTSKCLLVGLLHRLDLRESCRVPRDRRRAAFLCHDRRRHRPTPGVGLVVLADGGQKLARRRRHQHQSAGPIIRVLGDPLGDVRPPPIALNSLRLRALQPPALARVVPLIGSLGGHSPGRLNERDCEDAVAERGLRQPTTLDVRTTQHAAHGSRLGRKTGGG